MYVSLYMQLNYSFYKQNTCVKLKIENKNLSYSVKYKNLKKSVDFTLDNGGNYYIAYNSKIQFIGKDGKSYNVIENPQFQYNKYRL